MIENLQLILLRNGQYEADFHAAADPDNDAALLQLLIDAARRAGWGDHHLPEFSLEVHREYQRGIYKTVAGPRGGA